MVENNKLIKTNTIWYKIKSFLKKLFNRRMYNTEEKIIPNPSNNSFRESISVKKQLEEQEKKEKLALKLMDYDVDVYDLTDEEVDEMIEWFKQDIQENDRKLKRIKEHILQMRKESGE